VVCCLAHRMALAFRSVMELVEPGGNSTGFLLFNPTRYGPLEAQKRRRSPTALELGEETDSPAEEGGFEPSVPPVNELVSSAGHACAPSAKDGLGAVVYLAGTKGSNPVPSSGDSTNHPTPLA